MAARLDVLQDHLLNVYETGARDLDTQITYWQHNRKIAAILYTARQQGYRFLGLQPVPPLQTSEHNGKSAIQMLIYLNSLKDSEYANEEWSLSDTNAELVLHTEPKDTFKKQAYIVEVWFDNDPENANIYTNWDRIYYQDSQENWRVASGKVSHEGLYYEDAETGQQVLFQLFAPDAQRFGNTGLWTVKYKTATISSVVSSTSRWPGDPEETDGYSSTTARHTETRQASGSGSVGRQQETTASPRRATTTISSRGSPRGRGVRLGSRQGERPDSTGPDTRAKRRSRSRSPISPEEVGSRHQTVRGTAATRLGRLQADARDPPALLVKGQPNILKCWRNRNNKYSNRLFTRMSTVWRWLGDDKDQWHSRLLIAFDSVTQRERFLKTIKLPKGCVAVYASLDSL